jgi:hypothetical protein
MSACQWTRPLTCGGRWAELAEQLLVAELLEAHERDLHLLPLFIEQPIVRFPSLARVSATSPWRWGSSGAELLFLLEQVRRAPPAALRLPVAEGLGLEAIGEDREVTGRDSMTAAPRLAELGLLVGEAPQDVSRRRAPRRPRPLEDLSLSFRDRHRYQVAHVSGRVH